MHTNWLWINPVRAKVNPATDVNLLYQCPSPRKENPCTTDMIHNLYLDLMWKRLLNENVSRSTTAWQHRHPSDLPLTTAFCPVALRPVPHMLALSATCSIAWNAAILWQFSVPIIAPKCRLMRRPGLPAQHCRLRGRAENVLLFNKTGAGPWEKTLTVFARYDFIFGSLTVECWFTWKQSEMTLLFEW